MDFTKISSYLVNPRTLIRTPCSCVMTMEFSIFALFKCNLMQIRFLFRNLTMFHHERLELTLKHKNSSWLVMSSVRK
jgi:hypothetical protein